MAASRGQPVCRKEDCSPFDIGTVFTTISRFTDAAKFRFIENVWKLQALYDFPTSCGNYWKPSYIQVKPSSHVSAMVGDDIRMIAGNKLSCFLRFDRRWSPTIADIIYRRSHISQISLRRRKALIADHCRYMRTTIVAKIVGTKAHQTLRNSLLPTFPI